MNLKRLEEMVNDPDYTPDKYDFESAWELLPTLLAFVRAWDAERKSMDEFKKAQLEFEKTGKPRAGALFQLSEDINRLNAAREALNEPG